MTDYPEFDPNSDNVISREEVTHEITADVRSLARRVALQVLYQVDSSHQQHPVTDVVRYHLILDEKTGKIAEIDHEISTLVSGTVRQLSPDNPVTRRLHNYHLAFDELGVLKDASGDLAKHISSIVKYLEAEPDILRLANGVVRYRQQLDRILQKFAPEWPIDQVAIIDRNILRLALYEIAIDAQTPLSVAIDEAVNLARLFGAEGAPRFINGVLGTVAANLNVVMDALANARQEHSAAP
jgi:transcription antitermination factor NusB